MTYYVFAEGRMLGELTEDEARQAVEIMRAAGAPTLAKAFADACGFEPSFIVEVQCAHGCSQHEKGEWYPLKRSVPVSKETAAALMEQRQDAFPDSNYRIKEV